MYKNKYLKYKNKYLCLKNSMKGGAASAVAQDNKNTVVNEGDHCVYYDDLLNKYTLYCERGVTNHHKTMKFKYRWRKTDEDVEDWENNYIIDEKGNKIYIIDCEQCESKQIIKENDEYWRCMGCRVNKCPSCFNIIKIILKNKLQETRVLELQGNGAYIDKEAMEKYKLIEKINPSLLESFFRYMNKMKEYWRNEKPSIATQSTDDEPEWEA